MKKIILTLLTLISLTAGPVLMPAAALAAVPDKNVCDGIKATGATNCIDGSLKIPGIIKTVINLLSFIVGIAAVIMIIFGGLKYVTSGGDSNNTASAKNTIIYAIVGLVIVILAQTIVKFVLAKAS